MNKSTLCVFFLTLSLNAYSQFFPRMGFNENILKARVKQIDEFMSRFNLEEDWEGKRIAQNVDDIFYKKSITVLLNRDVFVQNGHLIKIAEEFVDNVVYSKKRLCFEDTTWFAKLDCQATLNGKNEHLTLYLQTQRVKEHEYVWIIKDVSGRIFNTQNQESTSIPFISPTEHEIGFIGLLDKSYKNANTTLLFGKSYSEDKNSMLACLLSSGLLKLTSINHLSFVFQNIPNWSFTVSRKEKEGEYNTGWLITSLHKLN